MTLRLFGVAVDTVVFCAGVLVSLHFPGVRTRATLCPLAYSICATVTIPYATDFSVRVG